MISQALRKTPKKAFTAMRASEMARSLYEIILFYKNICPQLFRIFGKTKGYYLYFFNFLKIENFIIEQLQLFRIFEINLFIKLIIQKKDFSSLLFLSFRKYSARKKILSLKKQKFSKSYFFYHFKK